MSQPVMDLVQALYDASHGLSLEQVQPAALDPDPDARAAGWRAFWRRLGFHTDDPVGSSRWLELALVQSTAGGSPRELLEGLLHVLGEGDPAVGTALEHFLRVLWATARCDPARFAEAFDLWPEVPAELTSAQAYLILRFVRDRARYAADAVSRLRSALDGTRSTSLTVDTVFGD